MKVTELHGAALDWAVAKAEGLLSFGYDTDGERFWVVLSTGETEFFSPRFEWAQAGPIIEREMISIAWTGEDWMAYIWHDEEFFASRPLIAAMRCYVASKLGEEIEVPAELLEAA